MSTNIISLIIQILLQKKNVMLHGPGGVGKSFLLTNIALALSSNSNVYVTATTGIAAVNLVGSSTVKTQTLHSWAGIGLGNGTIEELVLYVYRNEKAVKRWRSVQVLIVDEISMLGESLFKKLNSIACVLRENTAPFGGITLLFGGDFLQLPPVKDEWIFKSSEYTALNIQYINLSIPKRYTDPEYFQLLLRIRKGEQTEQDCEMLESRTTAYKMLIKQVKESKKVCIIPTTLFSRRDNTNEHNEKELAKLKHPLVVFTAQDEYLPKSLIVSSKEREQKLKAYSKILDDMLPIALKLKIGAQVMLKVNLDVDCGLVNGSRGVVIKLSDVSFTVAFLRNRMVTFSTRTVRTHEDKMCIVKRSQFPFILAWGLTIHSCQGCTLDSAVEDLGPSVFAEGQAYVSLSRIRSSKGLFLSQFYKGAIKVDQDALDFVKEIENNAIYNEDKPNELIVPS